LAIDEAGAVLAAVVEEEEEGESPLRQKPPRSM
jgi:hypothetical protein